MASNIGDFESARMISRILAQYYTEGRNQRDIASNLGVSVAKVNRMLKMARDQGWVEISIHTPFQFQGALDLERRLQKVSNVSEAVVVPQLGEDPDANLQAVGRAAAHYLVQHLRDGDTICISGGKAVFAISQALEPRRRYRVRVVPATGGVQGRYYTDVNYLATQIAERLGGEAYQLHAPIFVDSPEERDALLSVRKIGEVLDMARQAQIALVGVGSVTAEAASYFELTGLQAEDKKRFAEQPCTGGEILALVYDLYGQPCAAEIPASVVVLPPINRAALQIPSATPA